MTRVRCFSTLLLAVALATLPFSAAAERCPCGDLLLPYFEIDLPQTPGGSTADLRTVTFATGNRTGSPQVVAYRVWTNWGLSVLSTQKTLEAKSMFTVNLRDWLLYGRLPDGQLGTERLADLQAKLSGLPSPMDGRYYGSAVAPGVMVGYVTASVMAPGGAAHTLWGDTFALDPVEEDASGISLVRLVNDATRELCDHHLLRFLEGGPFDAHTGFVLWNGVMGQASVDPQPHFSRPTLSCVFFDEEGHRLGTRSLPLLATQSLKVADFDLPAPFGWAECDTGTLTFMCQDHNAGARFDVALNTFCLPQGQAEEPEDGAAIHLEKATNGFDADLPPGPTVAAGAPVQWEYVVTNTGSVNLLDVVVADDPAAEIECPQMALAPGDSMTCVAFGEAVGGQYHNLATATARGADGTAVMATDPSHYFGNSPGIGLEKLTNGEDADQPPGPQLVPGTAVTWTYVVTNTGNAPLSEVAVTDSQGVAVTCPGSTLDVGESMLCTATGTAVAGPYRNVGTAVGTTDDGQVMQTSDPSHYWAVPEINFGEDGCTPGYWKNHTGSWAVTGFSPSQSAASVFAAAAAYPGRGDATLLAALDFGGGPGVDGAAAILLRAAVAAALNAAHPSVDYPRGLSAVIADVDAALAGGSRDSMLLLAAALDGDNNLGCPLN